MITISSLHVEGLNGHLNYDLQFDERLNILVGKNGSGKTSVMKLLWYAMSRNMKLLGTDLKYDKLSGTVSLEDGSSAELERWDDKTFNNRHDYSLRVASYFFPTFRLIEGGFGIDPTENPNNYIDSLFQKPYFNITWGPRESFYFRKKHPYFHHTLILSLSSQLMHRSLINYYAEIRSEIEAYETSVEKQTETQLAEAGGDESHELKIYKDEKRKKKEFEEKMMLPFTTLDQLITAFYEDKSISIGEHLRFGTAEYAENIYNLSSGEKQLLMMLVYCLFSKDTIIFIDEPEISLDLVWQRKIIPTLLKIENGNQYFLATHSPAIYTGYLDYIVYLGPEDDEE